MSLLLDALLLLILILAIPVGAYRGGIREGFTAAGILLGAQLATEWAVPWGDFIGAHSALATDASRFLVALLLLLLATVIIGYGSSIAFTYHPGPGGRLFGGILGLLNGVLFVGFVIDFVIVFLFRDSEPDVIRHGYLSRGLSVGTGTILLIGCAIVIGAMLFGMLVRERDADQFPAFQSAPSTRSRNRSDHAAAQPASTLSAERAPNGETPARQEGEPVPVQIREIRHWEEPESKPVPPQLPESQWSQTWPRSSMGPSVQPPWTPALSAPTTAPKDTAKRGAARDDETLRDWLQRTGAAKDRTPQAQTRSDPRDVRDDLDE